MNSVEELPPDVLEALNAGRKIEAIKLLCDRGMGLREAKDAVESGTLTEPRRPHRASAKNDTGIGRLVLVFAVLGACLAAYFFLTGAD